MKLSLASILLFFCTIASGQIESPFSKGANFLGMGNAAAAIHGHSSLFYNQAGIASQEQVSASVHGGRLYDNSGLLQLHAGVVLPTKKYGTFAMRIGNYGLDGYNYQNYGVTYARKLFTNFSLAATFNVYQFKIENYGNSFVPNLEIGFLTDLSDRVSLGAHVANPFPLAISERTDFPTIFSVGVQYKVSEVVSLTADAEKNIRETQNFKIGIEYLIHPVLRLRAGINTFPGTFYFGLGVNAKQLQINLGNGYHPILGNSTGLSVLYRIGGK